MSVFITIEEQGLRDGLQTVQTIISTQQKLNWVNQLVEAGLTRIQVGSFVHPKFVPQMADTDELFLKLPQYDNVILSALVLNKKGVERAIVSGVKHLAISLSASNTHSKKNANKTIEEAKTECAEMIALALEKGIKVRGGVQCAFGCRYEGDINKNTVIELAEFLHHQGVQEIALADSTGMGYPLLIKETCASVLQKTKKPLALHLHNTENKGYANLIAAIEVGVTHFDTAFGGLGGCPFIKGATGNIATEDTVHMLHQMGYTTNIDIKKIANISKQAENVLQQKLPGLIYSIV